MVKKYLKVLFPHFSNHGTSYHILPHNEKENSYIQCIEIEKL